MSPETTRASTAQLLRARGIQPSAQRLAVAEYVLSTDEHPSAERVLARVQATLPMLSRATVYNALNLFVAKGLLKQHAIAAGRVIYDPVLAPHHHFVDDETGQVEDIPWDAVELGSVPDLPGYEVRDFMLVMRGKKIPVTRRSTGAGTGAGTKPGAPSEASTKKAVAKRPKQEL